MASQKKKGEGIVAKVTYDEKVMDIKSFTNTVVGRTVKGRARVIKDMMTYMEAIMNSIEVGEEIQFPVFSPEKKGVLKKRGQDTFSLSPKSK